MFSRKLKRGCFVLEGLNSFGTAVYFYYFYFFTAERYGFGNKPNLVLAAVSGAVYAVLSLYGGKFAQRHGYFTALKVGFGVMLASISAGLLLDNATAHVLLMLAAAGGMCFTWPALEALICEGEDRAGLQQMVGTYNVVWAGTSAIGYFLGGAILQQLGLNAIFVVPAGILVVQITITLILERAAIRQGSQSACRTAAKPDVEPHPHSPEETKCFVRMAWLANPFAYIGVNTLVAVMPGIAGRLELSTMAAGFCCSLWCFARLGAFAWLWRWGGWHYRFGWLLSAFIALVASFAIILLVPNLAVLLLSQIAFGYGLGLIYYSSLFYSMDTSDTKGEHGGIHEAAIGVGNFAGPALGAASLQLLPQHANSGAAAVTALLVFGLGGLLWVARGLRKVKRGN